MLAWLGGSQYRSRLVLRVEILLRRNTGAALGPDTGTVNRTICILVMFNVMCCLQIENHYLNCHLEMKENILDSRSLWVWVWNDSLLGGE